MWEIVARGPRARLDVQVRRLAHSRCRAAMLAYMMELQMGQGGSNARDVRWPWATKPGSVPRIPQNLRFRLLARNARGLDPGSGLGEGGRHLWVTGGTDLS
jgi:hypothetical protein